MSELKISIGDKVKLSLKPPYFKTADPMPMLRPPDIIAIGQEGIVIDRRPGQYWVVLFTKGSYLMEDQYLEVIENHISS